MSIDKAVEVAGLEMNGDVLAPGNRTQKHFKRLIHAVRVAEAAGNEELGKLNADVRRALQDNIKLRDQNETLRAELYTLKLKQRIDGLHLSEEVQRDLLALPSN